MYQQNQQSYPYPQQPGGYPGYPTSQPGYGAPPPPGPNINVDMGTGGGGWGGFGGGASGDSSQIFAEKAIRQAFVSKVFSIVGIQLFISTVIIALVVLNESNKLYFKSNPGFLILGFVVTLVTMLILTCVESARRNTPINFILLLILTLGYSLVAAVASSKYHENVVLGAFAATAGSVALLALFAKTTSFDMTNCGTTLCLLGLAHMIVGMFVVWLVPGQKGALILSVLGAALVSLYLIFDLQLIMGGRRCELSPEEYILAAVMLYTDIIQLFIYMLEIINRLSDD